MRGRHAHPAASRSLQLALGIVVSIQFAYSQNSTTLQQAKQVLASLAQQASEKERIGAFSEAIALREKSLQLASREVGESTEEAAVAWIGLGGACFLSGDESRAEKSWTKALEIERLTNPNRETKNTVAVYGWQTYAANISGDSQKALGLARKNLSATEAVFGKEHLEVARALNNLSNAQNKAGMNSEALESAERSLKILESTIGSSHPDYAYALDHLGSIHSSLGNHSEAVSYSKKAIAAVERNTNGNAYQLAILHSSLAKRLGYAGQYTEAASLLQSAYQTFKERLNKDNPWFVNTLGSLAGLYAASNNNEKALELSLAVLDAASRIYERDSIQWAPLLHNYGSILGASGKFQQAEEALHEAWELRKKYNGETYKFTTITLQELAGYAHSGGNKARAIEYARELVRCKELQLKDILLLDQNTRLAWQSGNLNFGIEACVLPDEELAEVVLRRKGVVLDSVIEDAASVKSAIARNPSIAPQIERLNSLRRELANITIAQSSDNSPKAQEIKELIAVTERSIGKTTGFSQNSRQALKLTISDIRARLSKNDAVLSFFRWYSPRGEGVKTEPYRYGAVIYTKDASPTILQFATCKEIDLTIKLLRSAIVAGDDSAVQTQSMAIGKQLLEKLAQEIPSGISRLFISPDGDLSFVPFSALQLPDGAFLGEKFNVVYISSERDLTREPSGKAANSLVVVADPVFDASGQISSGEDIVAMRSAEADVFGAINLAPLPGTRAEAEQLEVMAVGAGWEIKVAMRDEATESSVREAKKPGVLHLATHGFYLNSYSPPAEEGTRGMSVVGLNTQEDKKRNENGVDPMRASGVALTGAQQTLKLWSQRQAPDPETDGILTAEEVASLDLNGTWLVTLSACETGVGEARSGEGVFGLRRAFMMAGAENLLMTLWPVADDTTASIMADFYKEALATGDAPGSLAKVQRDWLVKLREEKGLAAAIREAGPFAMVMMTAPSHPPVELPVPSSSKSSWWPF